MQIHDFIADDIPELTPSDSGQKALDLMQDALVSELPLVHDDRLVLLVKMTDLLSVADLTAPLSGLALPVFRPVVRDQAHPYEAACRMSDLKLSLLPVVDADDKFKGVVSRQRLFDFSYQETGLNMPGGILLLRVRTMDYSLSQIARICENNDVLILDVQVRLRPDEGFMMLILKTNTKELQPLKASFERYEYQVVEIFGDLPIHTDLIDRYQLLMNYINM